MSKETWEEITEHLKEKLSCIIFSALLVELSVLVIMIVFEYEKDTTTDYFYLFSIITLMLSSIYFAWHSLVKENAFELIAFIVMASILNFQGIYQAITDTELTVLHWIAIVIFGAVQLFDYTAFYFVYDRFGWRAINEINSTNAVFIRAYKLYETFMSIIKLDFLLYSMTVAMYIYYVIVDWSSFDLEGILIGILVILFLIFSSLLGYFSVIII